MPRPTDGRRPKFRIICKRCNSYLHTDAKPTANLVGQLVIVITCSQCENGAIGFDEEFES